MKKLKIIIILLGLSLTGFAQNKGINFGEYESWEDVLSEAKRLNKTIFVDVYTTWCGPCKAMDQDIYSNKEIGDFFNKNFISIKVQMDKTTKDSDQIKKWYKEISKIKHYDIKAYPTLLFISSEGALLNRYVGFQSVSDLLETALKSLKPNQKYVSDAERYTKLIENYRKGDVKANELVKALTEINTSKRGVTTIKPNYFDGHERITDSLFSICLQYFRNQPSSALYNKDALMIIGTAGVSKNDPLFNLFYSNTSKVDKIVGITNFGRQLVDRAIRNDIFKRIKSSPQAIYKLPFNWDSLYNEVKLNYGIDYAERAIDAAKTTVLLQTHDYNLNPINSKYNESYVNMVNKHGLSIALIYEPEIFFGQYRKFPFPWTIDLWNSQMVVLEGFCINLLRTSDNEYQLQTGIDIMNKLVQEATIRQSTWTSDFMDTYARILYKTGKKEEAIQLEQQAINFTEKHKDLGLGSFAKKYKLAQDKMKQGEPLWPVIK